MKTLNKDGTPRKQGSGRKKGANSFANVTLADLEQFCGSATLIPISRVWLEKMGAKITNSEPTEVELASQLYGVDNDNCEAKISYKVHNFVDND